MVSAFICVLCPTKSKFSFVLLARLQFALCFKYAYSRDLCDNEMDYIFKNRNYDTILYSLLCSS